MCIPELRSKPFIFLKKIAENFQLTNSLQPLLNLLFARPSRVRHHGGFIVRLDSLARFCPGIADRGVVGVCPGCYGKDPGRGQDPVKFAEAGGRVVRKVDESAGEGVGYAVGGDVCDGRRGG